ncbi:hypothetical protein ABZ714_32515 [Streptomyces sp. NPDC006798]|uniref:hypothetical protein n=1 Tax=Streptomyces sp. NPDC006798 TaxID=3155462 RepID=UPI003404DBFF
MRAVRLASLTALATAAGLAVAAPATAAVTPPAPVPAPVPGSGTGTGGEGGALAPAEQLTSFTFTVTPASVAPGGRVTLRAAECQAPSVTASSDAFAPVTLTEELPATATVAPDARPGSAYDVTFDCQGERGTARLLVDAKAAARAGDTTDTTDPAVDEPADGDSALQDPADTGPVGDSAGDPGVTDPAVPDAAGQDGTTDTGAHDGASDHRTDPSVKPGGGVHAGAGGSLPEPGTERIAAGSALVTAAVAGGAVLFAVRRRRAATRG